MVPDLIERARVELEPWGEPEVDDAAGYLDFGAAVAKVDYLLGAGIPA